MSDGFKAVKVNEHVYWVGAIDWAVRDFHGYSTDRGTTYNAYLVLADKITLMDTVKAPFKNELLSRVASVIDPKQIEYIVSNHSEMDHSGCLPEVAEYIRPEKIFASTMGMKALSEHFRMDKEITAVSDGENLSLGNVQLTFMETKMLHWPDSMFSYLGESNLLFSQDAFGMHLATSERFSDQIEPAVLDWEAAKYYANILLPFSRLVAKLLERVEKSGLAIETIAPDHGPIWRGNRDKIIGQYSTWAAQKRKNKAVIAYDTMWGSTSKMARAISEALAEGGTTVRLMPMRSSHRSEVATELLDAAGFLVGSPTINNNVFPTVADLLAYVRGLKPQGLVGAAFGSYGWSGEAVDQVNAILSDMKVGLVGDGLKVKYVPDDAALQECRSLGSRVSEKLKEETGNGG